MTGYAQAMSEISQLALEAVDPAVFLDQTAILVGAAISVSVVGIFQRSGERNMLRLRGGIGWPEHAVGTKSIPAEACRPLYEALSTRDEIRFQRQAFDVLLQGAQEGLGVAVPLGERAARVGVLVVLGSDPARPFDDNDIAFLRTVAFIINAFWERRGSNAVLSLRNQALEALDQGMMISDGRRLDSPLIYVNPAFERLTGYRAAEALGKNPRFLQGPDSNPAVVALLRQTIERGETCRHTLVNYRRDGSQFWNDLTISPVRDAGGDVTHYVGILSDVTERLAMEAQLRQAQKMEAIGHLTGGIAHDFNNLLAVVMGNLEMLLDDTADEGVREVVKLVMKTVERGALLTQRLLAFGRRQALRPQATNTAQAIESMAHMLKSSLGEQVRLKTEDANSQRAVMVDRSMFESAILNLAVNARDAMPHGGELVISNAAVSTTSDVLPSELAPGDYVRVSVRDNGVGMSTDVLARVFEPFFTTKDVGRGSGLGLAMVHGFVNQSGGHVSIESASGWGTTVNLYLPVATALEESPVTPRTVQETPPHGTERILLVEDEAEVRRFVSRLLGRLGYSVVEAEDASTAIGVLKTANRIDLLFSDIILPGGKNGLALVETARLLRPDLKVLMTTGYTEEYERLAHAAPGLVLRKPYKRQELAETLRRVLDAA